MKNVVYFLVAVFMISCGVNSSKNNYEETITNYLLKGSDTKENLNFKIVEMNEQGTITVADSIAYLTDKFRKDKQLIIDRIVLAKKMSEELKAKTKKKSELDKYLDDIASMDNSIDSLKNLIPDNLNGYDTKNSSDVLAVTVRCKYSITLGGKSVEETFDFYLSPDGTKCYGKTRAR